MEVGEILISDHAAIRFKQRHKAFYGIKLTDEELKNKLFELIARAVPEEENFVLQERRRAHNGIGTYLINPPWRFVFSGEELVTCEIMPQDIIFAQNPRIPAGSEEIRLVVNINPRKHRSMTKFKRFLDERTLCLNNFIKVEEIIRVLRFLGVEVNQLINLKSLKFEIVVPRNIDVYRIDVNAPDSLIISSGQNDLFPLGRQKLDCSGIYKPDLERILEFFQIRKD